MSQPLKGLLELFENPKTMVGKRNDRLYDLMTARAKAEKSTVRKDFLLVQPALKYFQLFVFLFQFEITSYQLAFDSLDSQLVDELPHFLELTSELFGKLVTEYVNLRGIFIARCFKRLLPLMNVSFCIANQDRRKYNSLSIYSFHF